MLQILLLQVLSRILQSLHVHSTFVQVINFQIIHLLQVNCLLSHLISEPFSAFKGKEELNFDEFNNYSKRRKKAKIKSIISQIEKDEMPLPSYLWMHHDAGLSPAGKEQLLKFFRAYEYYK